MSTISRTSKRSSHFPDENEYRAVKTSRPGSRIWNELMRISRGVKLAKKRSRNAISRGERLYAKASIRGAPCLAKEMRQAKANMEGVDFQSVSFESQL